MSELWGIRDEDFYGTNKIKLIDGIAGAGKSSAIHRKLEADGVRYDRFTSTNLLRRNASTRYCMSVKTAASGLFKMKDLKIVEDKIPDAPVVVIDEVLQAGVSVLEWADRHRGEASIFLLTDEEQTMAPEGEKQIREKWESMKNDPRNILIHLTESYRPRDEKTREVYDKAYEAAARPDGRDLWENMKRTFPHRIVTDLTPEDYNENTVYITHTKEIESYFYKSVDLYNNRPTILIQKGKISSKDDVDLSKYPVLPQEEASGRAGQNGYVQPANVATPTRFQGSEVEKGRKLVYLVHSFSRVYNREAYTVLTRLQSVDDLEIWELPDLSVKKLTTYNRRPVNPRRVVVMTDKEKSAELLKNTDEMGNIYLTSLQAESLREYIKQTQNKDHGSFYDPSAIRIDGKCYKIVVTDTEVEKPQKQSRHTTPAAGVKKEPQLLMKDIMPAFMRAYERAEREAGRVRTPLDLYTTEEQIGDIMEDLPRAAILKKGQSGRAKQEWLYSIDIMGAFPQIMAGAKMPTGRGIYEVSDGYEPDEDEGEWITYWIIWDSDYIQDGAVITGSTVAILKKMDKKAKFHPICTMTSQVGTEYGKKIWNKLNTNQETKDKLKDSPEYLWGLLARHYLGRCGDGSSYYYEERNETELIYITIHDEMCRFLLKAIRAAEEEIGTLSDWGSCADALYLNEYTEALGPKIESETGMKFRISRNIDGYVMWKNYYIPTRREQKNARDRITKVRRMEDPEKRNRKRETDRNYWNRKKEETK